MKRWHLTVILSMLAGASVTLAGSLPLITAATVAAVQILAPDPVVEPAEELHSDLVQHPDEEPTVSVPTPGPTSGPLLCGGFCPPDPAPVAVVATPVRTIPELDEPRTIPELDVPLHEPPPRPLWEGQPGNLPHPPAPEPDWDDCPGCGMG